MLRWVTAILLLAILFMGWAGSAEACNHAAAPKQTAAPAPVVAVVTQATVYHSTSACPHACLGACCCIGGMASCSPALVSGQALSAFDLPSARGAQLGWGGERTAPYREPLYGLDRPPKA